MNKLIGLVLATLFVTQIYAQSIRLSEPVASDEDSETFGQILNQDLTQLNLAELIKEADQHLGKPVKVKTRIAKVCQKKGCFFIAQQDEHVVRVSFRDYSFFIPTDSSGKTVTLAGELIQKNRSQEQATHFNSDIGTSANQMQAGLVYEIVADSVRIPKS